MWINYILFYQIQKLKDRTENKVAQYDGSTGNIDFGGHLPSGL